MTDMTTGLTTITDRLLALRSPQHASLSPDGRQLLLTTAEVPVGSDDEVVRNTVLDIGTGVESGVAVIGLGEHSPVWAPDGRGLAWCATSDEGRSVLKAADSVDGQARVLHGSAGASGPPAWSPDGTFIVVPALRGTTVDRSRPYRWTRPIAAADGIGPLDDPPQLLLVDVRNDSSRWLTDDGWRWSLVRWSTDGTRLAALSSIDPEGRCSGTRARVVSLDGDIIDVGLPGGRGIALAWLPDGRLVAMVAEPRSGDLGGDAELYIVDGSTPRRIDLPNLWGDVYGDNPAILPEAVENVLLSDGTGRLVLRVGERGRLGVVRVHPDRPADVEVIADGVRCCTPVGAVGDTVAFTTQHVQGVPDIAVVDAVGGPERRITSFGGSLENATNVRRFSVAASGGWSLDGWFVSPTGTTGPLPTVVVIHGGPHYSFGEVFSIDVHALCAAGFGVLFTNPRGSTGYGAAFARACHGDWANGPASDILAVLDHAIGEGWVDASRVGVDGLSYGGYLSAWLASTTDRFRAAVIENPVTDLASMYGTSDIGVTFFAGNFGGAPHEVIDRYLAQSPIMRAHECRTPSLFVVGEVDRRCPPPQAWAMHRVLCHVGTPSEMLILPGCSHEGTTYGPPVSRRAHDEAFIAWMTRWVMAT